MTAPPAKVLLLATKEAASHNTGTLGQAGGTGQHRVTTSANVLPCRVGLREPSIAMPPPMPALFVEIMPPTNDGAQSLA